MFYAWILEVRRLGGEFVEGKVFGVSRIMSVTMYKTRRSLLRIAALEEMINECIC